MELQGKCVAILAEDRYDDLELWYPALRLREAGARVVIVGTGAPSYTSTYGMPVRADISADQVDAGNFDAIVIPGGAAPQAMREHPAIVALVHEAIQRGKIIAAIDHAGRTLLSAQGVHQDENLQDVKRLFGMEEEALNAEGPYEDSVVIRTGNLIIARTPVDLPAFCRMIIAALTNLPTSDSVGGMRR